MFSIAPAGLAEPDKPAPLSEAAQRMIAPEGLLESLSSQEVLDLVDYLQCPSRMPLLKEK